MEVGHNGVWWVATEVVLSVWVFSEVQEVKRVMQEVKDGKHRSIRVNPTHWSNCSFGLL